MESSSRWGRRGHRRSALRLPLTGVLCACALLTLPGGAAARTDSPSAVVAPRVDYFFVSSLHSRPWRITPGPDGNLWFTDLESDMVGEITTAGEITEYPIGEGKRPYDIVAGREGLLWFTENVNNKTGAVDTEGNLVHEYYAPGVDARPTGITVAPNGDIWWVDGGSGFDPETNVSRLRPNGTVTNYQLAPCACFGQGITVGPDGKLWAIEELGVHHQEAVGTVDRISLNGRRIARYPIPAPPFTEQHLPGWPAAGPDGNVWFTEFNLQLHQVGTITPDGTITEYELPGELSGTGSIVTGIDGNLWVSETATDTIAILGTDGSLLRRLSVHQQPFGITIGPDGNMWFTNALSGEIGRVQTAQPGVGYVLDIAPGFVPAQRDIGLGDKVQWVLEAPGFHGVRDATGLSLFDSGLQPPVSFASFVFESAGSYAYEDPQNGDTGVVGVPPHAPATGTIGSPFRVTWSRAAPASGLVFDVQYLPPGSGTWIDWRHGVTSTRGSLLPTAGGEYQFRALLRKADGSAGTDWSPPASVIVS